MLSCLCFLCVFFLNALRVFVFLRAVRIFFLRALRGFIFLRALCAYLFYVPNVSSFLNFFKRVLLYYFHALRVFAFLSVSDF